MVTFVKFCRYSQLSDTVLSEDKAGDLNLSFQAVRQFCVGRTFLVVLDDVWNLDVEKKMSFIDENTPSRMLISTRIRGLIKSAKEVQISLLTNSEAIQMLTLMAELDTNETIPSEVMPIVQLCGVCFTPRLWNLVLIVLHVQATYLCAWV